LEEKKIKREICNQYQELINNKTFTINLLVACVAKNEIDINKSAYLYKKWKNCYTEKLYESHKGELDHYIGIRKTIHNIISDIYSLDELKEKAKTIDKDNYPSKIIIDEVLALINNDDFTLCLTDSLGGQTS